MKLKPLSLFFIASLFLSLGVCAPALAQTSKRTKALPKKVSPRTIAPKKPKTKSAAGLAKSKALPPMTGNVTKISVSGNKKIEADAIKARVKTKPGSNLDADQIREDVQSIFRMGYFYDVTVDRSGGEITFGVVEKPSMAEIKYEGNEEINDEDLAEATGLKPYEILDMNKIREAMDKMSKAYEEKGFFLASIKHSVKDIQPGETVELRFDIEENDKVKVKKITFLGNRYLKDGDLKGKMGTQEGGFFSFISGSGSYKQEIFDRDVQLLQYLYFNEGYVQVKVDRPQVYVTPDKKSVYITIRVEEGDQFGVGNVDFAGDLLFGKDELYEGTEIQHSNIFVYETLQKDLRTLQAKYGDLGYAFANIIPRTQIREKDKKVDITFEIDKGQKVYFGEINVSGNNKTRDKVVRRELRVKEGELYNETRKRESLENVKRLGFFEDVAFNTSTPVDKPDVLNVDIVVKERNTGSIQVGAGYSTYSLFLFNARVDQANLFGRGQSLGVSVDLSSKASVFKLSFTEPYFLDTEWSVGGDLYQDRVNQGVYEQVKKGAAVRIGHPLAPYLKGFIRYKLDNTEITNVVDPVIYPVETANGMTSSVTFNLEYDKRDDRFSPSKGFVNILSLEYAGLGGDKKYTIGYGTVRYFQKVFWDVVFRNNLTYGFISAPEGKEPPFNELFLLGGANSLRGYRWGSVGRRKVTVARNSDGTPVTPTKYVDLAFGGKQELFYIGEFEFPLIREAGIKGVLFFDAGQSADVISVGNKDDDRNCLLSASPTTCQYGNEIKTDVGFGFRWFSPIGPLRFEWGFPLNRTGGEDAVNFEFMIGSPF